MSRNSRRNSILVPGATSAMNQMKMEAASELGVNLQNGGYNGELTSREAGSIGGSMTRKLVQLAQSQMAGSNMH